MAFNGMKVIHSGLGNRLRYIMNPAKTENGLLTAGINTTPQSAPDDMMETKLRYDKLDKRQGYHIIQSFAPGEITPDDALRFGLEFVEKYLDNRYEGVATVHTDKAHVHIHIIFNSVSFIDGKKYHAARGEYLERIRELCDEQCKAWGLSVIEGDFTKVKTTKDEARCVKQGKPTCRDQIRFDIDRAIRESMRWSEFITAIRKQGYAVKETAANVFLKAPGMKRFIRLRSLGKGYSKDEISKRMYDGAMKMDEFISPQRVPLPQDETDDHYIGSLASYYNVIQQMRHLIDRQHMRYAPALRAEIRKLDQWQEDWRFQERYGITNVDRLREQRALTEETIATITRQRDHIYAERRKAATRENPTRMAELDAKLKEYRTILTGLRREVRIANRIEDRLLNKVEPMLAAARAQDEIRQELHPNNRMKHRDRER